MAVVEAPPLTQKMHDLTGQVALVAGIGCIGDGWGNGIAIATLFARQGAILFGCDLSLEAAEKSKQQILAENANTDITVMHGNVTSSSSMEAVVTSCVQQHGRIDILVNNVGRAEPGDPVSMAEDVWDRQIELNLKSVYISTHLVLPIMEKQSTGGSVVNISSVAGLRYIGSPHVAYTTAKGAIHSFTSSTAVMYASKGVRLNTVVPGLINTPLARIVFERLGEDYSKIAKLRDAQVPMGRMGTAWDIANAVLFLASREAKYITGTELVVDGGLIQSTGRM